MSFEPSWRPVAELPDELIRELETEPTVEVRRDGARRSDRWLQLLLVPGIAFTLAGVMAVLLLPGSPISSPLRIVLLTLGATSLATWLAWYRTPSVRPLGGQGVLLTPSTVVLADHTSVAVIPAEEIVFDGEAMKLGDRVLHRTEEILLDRARQAGEADLETRKADPWRPLARAAGGQPQPMGRARRLGKAAVTGLVAAAALELIVGFTLGRSRERDRQQAWTSLHERIDEQMTRLIKLDERALTEAIGQAENTEGLGYLVSQALDLEKGSERRARVLKRYRFLAAEELGAATHYTAAIDVLLRSAELGLPEDFLSPMRARLGELLVSAGATQFSYTGVEPLLSAARAHGVSQARIDALQDRYVQLAQPIAIGDQLQPVARLYASATEALDAGHPLRVSLQRRVGDMVRAELPAIADTRQLYYRFYFIRRLPLDDETSRALDARFEELARAQASTITETEILLDYFRLDLGDDFNEFIKARYEQVARAEIAAARSGDDIHHFQQEARTLGLSDDFVATLQARLDELEQAAQRR